MPPLLLTSDLNLFLPSPSRLWRAESAWQWQEARQSSPLSDITVRDAFARLFGRSAQGLPPNVSSLGHYVLIHALTQHIYLLKQTSLAPASPYELQRGLRPEDVEEVTQALRIWQNSFEHRHQLRAQESVNIGFGDSFPGGPVAFNATALLRLAYIRLYTDISPSRSLETRDHMLVASSLSNMALVVRNPRLHRAVFQAIHALSMLVKAGVNYVARAKSLEWSIQHSREFYFHLHTSHASAHVVNSVQFRVCRPAVQVAIDPVLDRTQRRRSVRGGEELAGNGAADAG